MTIRTLTVRELNRTTLARQMLLEREAMSVPDALERLAGMQAQQAIGPYVGLWTRLRDFERDDLARLIEAREVVKATLMRGTLHIVTTADYLRFRGPLQVMLSDAQESIAGRRGADTLDIPAVIEAGRKFFAEGPHTFAELTDYLVAAFPEVDHGALRYTVRTYVPLVQVPNDYRWSYPGNAQFTLAESWLKQPIPDNGDGGLPLMIRRYLAGFGPASVTDMQTWSGLKGLGPVVEAMRGELVVYKNESRVELFDLPGMPAPHADTPAPARFLPEFDNLLLSHAKRTRIFADEHRKAIWAWGNLRVRPTILSDGFVAGTWAFTHKRGEALITVEPFAPLPQADRAALEEEGERLVQFIEPKAKTWAVRFEG
jgi:hypothetical protein